MMDTKDERNSKNTFVVFGDTRIKISNIKNYGIKTETSNHTRTARKTAETIQKENEQYYKEYEEKIKEWEAEHKKWEDEQIWIKHMPVTKKIGRAAKKSLKGAGTGFLSVGACGGIIGTLGGLGGAAVGGIVGGVVGTVGGLVIGPLIPDKPPNKPEIELQVADETYEEKYTITKSCLYVTTFQRDNFVFHEGKVPFDIFKKCKELDALLCKASD